MVTPFFTHKLVKTLAGLFALAIVYLCLGQLSTALSSLTPFTQLISFESGFALATIMTFSRPRAFAAIAFGALALSFYRYFNQSNFETMLLPVLVMPAIAVLMQMFVGLKIYRIWISDDNQLSKDTELIRFIIFVPVIALINTCFATFVSLAQEGGQTISIFKMLVAWSGETVGLSLILPLTLSILNPRAMLWRRRRTALIINFSVALCFLFLANSSLSSFYQNKLKDRFAILTNQTTTLFQVLLNERSVLQNSTAGLFVTSGEVTRNEFKHFVSVIAGENSYIQVIEWLPKITHEQRDAYEAEQRQYFGDTFSIKEIKAKGQVVTADERDEYYPITYLEPEWDNDLAKGFDPSTSDDGKMTMEKAVRTGESQARSPIEVVRNSGFKTMFIVYRAIYQQDNGEKTLDAHQGHVIGFINVVLRVDDFMNTILDAKQTDNFTLQWIDSETGQAYFSNKPQHSAFIAPFEHKINIHNSGRAMQLIFTPTEQFMMQEKSESIVIILDSVLVIASFFSILVLNISARTLRIESEVKKRTRQLKIANHQLELLSNKDMLTNLYNRRYFEQTLQNEFTRAKRYNSSFSLVIFDVDFFKKINDKWGHPGGDEVLKIIGEYLNQACRKTDTVARIGGEEFALILLDQTYEQTRDIVENIRVELSQLEIHYQHDIIGFTCSFGVTLFEQKINSTSDIVKQADDAMYQAKQAGRNQVKIYNKAS